MESSFIANLPAAIVMLVVNGALALVVLQRFRNLGRTVGKAQVVPVKTESLPAGSAPLAH
jgi:hypothetical protein